MCLHPDVDHDREEDYTTLHCTTLYCLHPDVDHDREEDYTTLHCTTLYCLHPDVDHDRVHPRRVEEQRVLTHGIAEDGVACERMSYGMSREQRVLLLKTIRCGRSNHSQGDERGEASALRDHRALEVGA